MAEIWYRIVNDAILPVEIPTEDIEHMKYPTIGTTYYGHEVFRTKDQAISTRRAQLLKEFIEAKNMVESIRARILLFGSMYYKENK